MTQGPAALGLPQSRGQASCKCQPSAFFHKVKCKRATVVEGGLMATQDHALAQSPGAACPSGCKGLTVLVTLLLLAATRSACRHLT